MTKNLSSVILYILICTTISFSQSNNSELPTSINNQGVPPHQSALLDVQSQEQGVLIPRMNFSQIQDIVNPAEGLMVFDTEFGCLRIYFAGQWDCLYSKASSKLINGDLSGWNVPFDNEADPIEFDINSKGQIVLVGDFSDGYLEYLATYDKSGNLIWSDTTMDRESRVMVVDQNDFIYLLGETNIGYAISKLDENGNLIWQKPIGYQGGSFFRSIELDDDGNIYIAGTHSGDITVGQVVYPGQGSQDCSIVKYDSDGNLLWLQTFGGSEIDRLANISVDSNGNVYALGNFGLNFTASGETIYSAFYDNIFVLKYDTNGVLSWINSIDAEESMKIWDCVINDFDEAALVAVVPDNFTYAQDEVELGLESESYLMTAVITSAGDLKIKGKTGLSESISRPFITTATNGDFYVSIDMQSYTGNFGSVNFNDCRGDSYLVKYPYLNVDFNKSFDWIVPLPMYYGDMDYADGSIYLFGTLRGDVELGNTMLTQSHSDHNIAVVKYVE